MLLGTYGVMYETSFDAQQQYERRINTSYALPVSCCSTSVCDIKDPFKWIAGRGLCRELYESVSIDNCAGGAGGQILGKTRSRTLRDDGDNEMVANGPKPPCPQ